MRIYCLIHAAFEKPGVIETWAKDNGHEIYETHTYKGEHLPAINEFDLLIVMGGPQSPLGVDKWPYLRDEMTLIKKSITANKAILGVCLGAQLIAESMGAKTESSPQREIGVFPLNLTADAASDPVFSQFPETFPAMHWHNDMPGLPKDAKLLATSAGCPRQVFRVGDRIYGLQCHLEMTQQNIVDMITFCENDLVPDHYVDTKQQLLNHDLKGINNKMCVLLDYLSSVVA